VLLSIVKLNLTCFSRVKDYDFNYPSLPRLDIIMDIKARMPMTNIIIGFKYELKMNFFLAGSSLFSSEALKTSMLFLWSFRNLRF
jgi:hypothetical protein